MNERGSTGAPCTVHGEGGWTWRNAPRGEKSKRELIVLLFTSWPVVPGNGGVEVPLTPAKLQWRTVNDLQIITKMAVHLELLQNGRHTHTTALFIADRRELKEECPAPTPPHKRSKKK